MIKTSVQQVAHSTLAKNGWLAEDGWVKRVQNVNGVEIHYIENTKTGQKTDFKFKD